MTPITSPAIAALQDIIYERDALKARVADLERERDTMQRIIENQTAAYNAVVAAHPDAEEGTNAPQRLPSMVTPIQNPDAEEARGRSRATQMADAIEAATGGA